MRPTASPVRLPSLHTAPRPSSLPIRRRRLPPPPRGTPETAAAAAAAADAALADPVVSVAFGVATAALVVLTAGVAYLSLQGWLDDQAEKAERKKAEQAAASRAAGSVGGARKPPKAKKVSSRGGKGFGG